ncbi:MAG: hypothetical protein QOC73_2386 [Actinomycetota bacterium]|nr:hypothetical protein [Actinomycetota bacterium]MDQ1493925.1 hypothetical protein [Actinomycetota bacterium]
MSSRSNVVIAKTARGEHPLARLLIDSIDDSVRGTRSALTYAGVDADALEAAVFVHKIAPAVYVHLRDAGDAPKALLEPMQQRYQLQVARQLQVMSDAAGLVAALTQTGVAWAAMKGPVLAERLWSRPDLRTYIDLDILVDRRRFGDVLDALLESGAQMVDQNWALIAHQTRAEVSLVLPNGTSLDLHWHVVNDRGLRSQFTFPIADMLARTVDAKIGNTTLPTLDPADTLLHLAYHTAHSGGHRLMWLKDVERATADPGLDWDETLLRAKAYGVRLPLAIVLARTARVIGFEVAPPEAAFAPARRTAWGAFAAAADRWSPAPTLPADKFSGQFAFKNARKSTSRSIGAALVAMKNRRAPAFDPTQNKLYIEAGGDAARASYLAVVQGGLEP